MSGDERCENSIIQEVSKHNYISFTEEPVEFSIPLKDVDATEGEPVTFECTINKDRDATWMKDGEEITRERGYDIRRIGRRHLYTIPEVSPEDEGEYSVVFGRQSSTAKLSVEGKGIGFLEINETA